MWYAYSCGWFDFHVVPSTIEVSVKRKSGHFHLRSTLSMCGMYTLYFWSEVIRWIWLPLFSFSIVITFLLSTQVTGPTPQIERYSVLRVLQFCSWSKQFNCCCTCVLSILLEITHKCKIIITEGNCKPYCVCFQVIQYAIYNNILAPVSGVIYRSVAQFRLKCTVGFSRQYSWTTEQSLSLFIYMYSVLSTSNY